MPKLIPNIFHIDLSQAIPEEEYWLYADGKKYFLKAHTSETLALAKVQNPNLQTIPDAELTHYTAEIVPLPDHRAVRLTVRHTTTHTPRIPNHYGIHHVHVFVPPTDMKVADDQSAEQPVFDPDIPGFSNVIEQAAYYLQHSHINTVSTAKSTLFHHPDLLAFDASTAQVVMEHFGSSSADANYQKVQDLANYIKSKPNLSQTPNEGWAYWEAFDATDAIAAGSIAPPPQGMDSYYTLKFAADFYNAGQPAAIGILNSTRNDNRLKNKKWNFQLGKSVESAEQAIEKKAIATAEVTTSADEWEVKVATTKRADGVSSSVTVIDGDAQTVELYMANIYVRWLSVYVTFYDADGNHIELDDDWHSEDVSDLINTDFNFWGLQSSTHRYLGVLSPVDTIEGLPVTSNPGDNTFTFSFPEGAVQARFYACGLGTGSTHEKFMPVIGGSYTALANLVIPGVLFFSTAASFHSKTLYDQMASIHAHADLIKLIVDTVEIFEGAFNLEVAWDALEDIAKILFHESAAFILASVIEDVGEAEAEDSIPVVGWVIAMKNMVVDLVSLGQTMVEIATSPVAIKNTLSTTINTQINIHPDPRHAQAFPQGAAGQNSSYQISIYRQNDSVAKIIMATPSQSELDNLLLSQIYKNQLGGKVKIDVNYVVGQNILGKASSGWLENNRATMDQVVLYLVQIPIPITPNSQYVHSAITTFDIPNSQYEWSMTGNQPTATSKNLNPETSGNSISQLRGLALSQRYGMIGTSWEASGMGILPADADSDSYNAQLNAFQNLNIPNLTTNHPIQTLNDEQFPSQGFNGSSKLIYDIFPQKFEMTTTTDGEGQEVQEWVLDDNGQPIPDPNDLDLGGYYVDPRKSSLPTTEDGGFHLRKVTLNSPVPAYNMDDNQNSWGRFPYFPNSLTIHPLGFIVGINSSTHKLMILPLPEGDDLVNGTDDTNAQLARVFCGQAQDYDNNGGLPGTLFPHAGLTCTYDGTIVVLEQVSNSDGLSIARLQAFDSDGNPVAAFNATNEDNTDADGAEDGKSPFFYLPHENITYLDVVALGDANCTYIYLLSYLNQGDNPEDYQISIYQLGTNAPANNFVVANTNMPAGKINVDMWHTLYTLNFEMVKNGTGTSAEPAGPTSGGHEGPAGRTVPSVSEWIIVNPTE